MINTKAARQSLRIMDLEEFTDLAQRLHDGSLTERQSTMLLSIIIGIRNGFGE